MKMKFKLLGTPWSPRRAREVTDEPRRTRRRKWQPAEAVSYTADVLNYLSATASGHALRGTAAAIEICAGVWQRGMATAEVSPQNGRTASLTPTLLGYVGRYLLLRGEVPFRDRCQGNAANHPDACPKLDGAGWRGPRTSWVYECHLPRPIWVRGSGHFRAGRVIAPPCTHSPHTMRPG